MGYDLFLSAPGGAAVDPGAAKRALDDSGGADAGPQRWRFREGLVDVSVALADKGLAVSFDYGGPPEEARKAVVLALALAQKLGLVVFDPQLGREVGAGDAESVVDRWRVTNTWSVDVAGTAGLLRSDVDGSPSAEKPPMSAFGRTALIVGVGALVFVMVKSCASRVLGDLLGGG